MFKALVEGGKGKEDDKMDRYIITYDYPTYPEDGTDSVIEALKLIGKVKKVPCAPSTTIGFTANKGVEEGKVRSTVRTSLDEKKPERKVVVARISVEPGAWFWPQEDTAESRKNGTWRTIF